MNRLIASALAAAVTIALPATAFAETLDYTFTVEITTLSDDYGVFQGLEEGDPLDVFVHLDTEGESHISVVGMTGATDPGTVYYSGSWAKAGGNWQGATQINALGLTVNDIAIEHTVDYQQQVYLQFSELPGGGINTGWLELRLNNTNHAFLHADYVTSPPTSVPELDPKSGAGAIALLVGGMALAFSRRRRQTCDGVVG